jgi:hypothetical protein
MGSVRHKGREHPPPSTLPLGFLEAASLQQPHRGARTASPDNDDRCPPGGLLLGSLCETRAAAGGSYSTSPMIRVRPVWLAFQLTAKAPLPLTTRL